MNDNEIRIKMSTKRPIGNCGDGVSVNQKAARILKDVYGMSTLDFRCSSHATDGSLKRIAKSESMSVEEVKSLYLSLRSVVKHFHCSVKSKELLDKALEMIEIEKGIHLISWCSTRIGHFLTACDKANSSLVPLYNMMYSCGTRQEERDKLFRAESVYLLKLLCDIRSEFYVRYLRPVDQQVYLVSSTYNISNFTATQI